MTRQKLHHEVVIGFHSCKTGVPRHVKKQWDDLSFTIIRYEWCFGVKHVYMLYSQHLGNLQKS